MELLLGIKVHRPQTAGDLRPVGTPLGGLTPLAGVNVVGTLLGATREGKAVFPRGNDRLSKSSQGRLLGSGR